MKNEKSVYKYSHNNEIGFMHYVVYEGDVVVLSKEDSLKVEFIEKNGFLNITADIRKSDYEKVKCNVVHDKTYVKNVFNYMIETNNAYFYDSTEGLCAIIFETS